MALVVKKGYLSLYYCFDVAEEILLGRVEKVFGEAPQKSALKFTRLAPPYLQYREAPLVVSLGTEKVGSANFVCTAKVYDFGVITVRLSLPLVNVAEDDLLRLSGKYVENQEMEKFARGIMERVKGEVQKALVNPTKQGEDFWEDYSVFFVHEFQHALKGADFLTKHRDFVAKLVKGEKQKLSVYEQADAVKYFISYYENDIALIDWNAAFVYDPQQGFEMLDVLEYAVIELLELRAYDMMLDQALDRAYDDISKRRVPGRTLRTLSQVRLDIASVIEKVENCLKLVGDLYLAKVYTTAAARFYLDRWKRTVKEKLETIDSLYKVLYERKQTGRMVVLEVLIVLFFIIDLVLVSLELFVLK